ncbi:uncharacterized protein [Bactrocera oleae]|uniref:uncharacterized protein isoform X3 n=1 Tax=Bactrocera oleae TaxID=104688 RepID=UPI00387EE176
MPSDTQNCLPKPIFKGLTQLFLNGFGTNKLPEGYMEGDEYGPKTKKQDFTALFTSFYILIVLAVLCVLTFLLTMLQSLSFTFRIVFLVWYCNRDKYKPELSRNPKLCTLLLTSLLLLSLILLALFLFSTFTNLYHLKKLYKKPKNDSSTEDAVIMQRIIEILDNNFENLRNDSMNGCRNSPSLTDLYPETTKARKLSIANGEMFEDFIETFIEPIFDNTLLYDDLFRSFSRNFSAFLAVSKKGGQYILSNNASHYNYEIFSLDDWEGLYNSIIAIKDLMNFYKDSASSELRRSRVCYQVSEYFNKLASYARGQQVYLAEKLKSHSLSEDPLIAPPYKFAHVACIMAIVVLVMFFLLVMCSLCTKGNVMIKALLFIYIILTLLLILMAFVTFYHFFYGIIEYNGFCHKMEESAEKQNFNHVMLTDCTNDQNFYTLLLENNLIPPFSKWIDLNTAKIQEICEDTCRPLNMTILQRLRPEVEKLPKKNHFCKFKSITSTWLTPIRLAHVIYNSRFLTDDWIIKINETYYHDRVKFSNCNLNMAVKASKFNPTVSKMEFWKCRAAYIVGRDFAVSIPSIYGEVKDMCKTTYEKCVYYNIHDVPIIITNVNNYKTNVERSLKNALGSCATILDMIKAKQNKSCNCETYILNGVWIGGLLFVITLFLALLLLAGFIFKLVICRDHRDERHGGRSRDDDSAESILLPPITLPRRVIDTLENDENPRVTYHIKKLN